MSEGYEGHDGAARRRTCRPRGLAMATAPVVGPGPDDAQIPFLGHTFRVSGLRDELHARRAAPDGWIRHA
ncbi:hypothetical protein GCM10011579_069840 [Streptomyces albiflavescens]|uniref:Uncharacterized protein n=1 Tax=Streptomyces albiflavescens TaxID=1623582 RepID=A0A917YCD7_9ACTN|nr:hypothetical protein GCM10011579_069840 [Streptomyces albiflavescens]